MPTHELHGPERVEISQHVVLQPLRALYGTVRTGLDTKESLVLGGVATPPALANLPDFAAAHRPFELWTEPPAPLFGVPLSPGMPDENSAEMAMLEFEVDPAEHACYALMQEIHTPDGIIYDMTLPQSATPSEPGLAEVLGISATPDHKRYFPLHRMVSGTLPIPPDVFGSSATAPLHLCSGSFICSRHLSPTTYTAGLPNAKHLPAC
ncbi:MAG: hypothetical protein HC876_06890 [Chloroflexaceae bacterium]|nr:hypothetical protein [Chloroflexaceae bacterium]